MHSLMRFCHLEFCTNHHSQEMGTGFGYGLFSGILTIGIACCAFPTASLLLQDLGSIKRMNGNGLVRAAHHPTIANSYSGHNRPAESW